jgi:nitric-oxide synthase
MTPEDIFKDLLEHLDYATNGGKIRSTISVYPPFSEESSGIRIWNKQLIRYAGYDLPDGGILGDPDSVEFTRYCQSLGWKSLQTAFDVLPLVIQVGNDDPKWFEIPEEKILRVPLTHPEFSWFDQLDLQWYAVPVISDMRLEIGGISFPCAPFNGWYMLTEIAVRNLADSHRYNLLPLLAEKMNLDIRQSRSLWKDKCLLVLQEAVLHSFQEKGVTLVDHHSASEQFLKFCRIEEKKGRVVRADWSWIVPPVAGSTMGVFHREWENEILSPNFFYQTGSWQGIYTGSKQPTMSCPFHSSDSSLKEVSTA